MFGADIKASLRPGCARQPTATRDAVSISQSESLPPAPPPTLSLSPFLPLVPSRSPSACELCAMRMAEAGRGKVKEWGRSTYVTSYLQL
eukprot:3189690-Rhodomonas_salina.1